MNNEQEVRNSTCRFEIEGNVGNIQRIYTNANGKKSLRFDLGQNNNGNSQFLPVVIRGELVNSYADDIAKGNWITVKGRISSYLKDVEQNGESHKEKVVELLGFEITDRTTNKVYSSDGTINEIQNNIDKMER